MASSPTARTLQRLRSNGWTAAVVERWIPQTQRRRDLFGWMDILAIRADLPGSLGIQATSRSNAAARWKKLVAAPELRTWLMAENCAEVWSWKKDSRGRWDVVRRPVMLEDLAP